MPALNSLIQQQCHQIPISVSSIMFITLSRLLLLPYHHHQRPTTSPHHHITITMSPSHQWQYPVADDDDYQHNQHNNNDGGQGWRAGRMKMDPNNVSDTSFGPQWVFFLSFFVYFNTNWFFIDISSVQVMVSLWWQTSTTAITTGQRPWPPPPPPPPPPPTWSGFGRDGARDAYMSQALFFFFCSTMMTMNGARDVTCLESQVCIFFVFFFFLYSLYSRYWCL